MIEIGRQKFPYITFRVGCANDLPYCNYEFDVVASSLMMHYIKNLVPVFKEVCRILQEGGQFILFKNHLKKIDPSRMAFQSYNLIFIMMNIIGKCAGQSF